MAKAGGSEGIENERLQAIGFSGLRRKTKMVDEGQRKFSVTQTTLSEILYTSKGFTLSNVARDVEKFG